jgi:endogenous inhibitor of DNA gyrase (YacG/DUF329 family)
MATKVDCPNCGTPVSWKDASPWRPFCSERCRLIDLGDWAAERHIIPGKLPLGNTEEPREQSDRRDSEARGSGSDA